MTCCKIVGGRRGESLKMHSRSSAKTLSLFSCCNCTSLILLSDKLRSKEKGANNWKMVHDKIMMLLVQHPCVNGFVSRLNWPLFHALLLLLLYLIVFIYNNWKLISFQFFQSFIIVWLTTFPLCLSSGFWSLTRLLIFYFNLIYSNLLWTSTVFPPAPLSELIDCFFFFSIKFIPVYSSPFALLQRFI